MVKFKKIFILQWILFIFLFSSNMVFAESQEFSAEGQYKLGDNDSRNTAKENALADAKRKIIEQAVGVYVETYSEVKNFKLTEDSIRTASKAVIKIKSEKVDFYENGTLCKAFIVAMVDTTKMGDFLKEEIAKSVDQTSGKSKKAVVSKIPKDNAYIPKGTTLSLQFKKTVSSTDVKKGDEIYLKLADNLIINDKIVAKEDTAVKGVVLDCREAGKYGKSGKIKLRIISFTTSKGKEIELNITKELKESKSGAGAVAVSVFSYGIGGYFMKGKNIVLEEGAKIDVKTDEDIDLHVKWSELAS